MDEKLHGKDYTFIVICLVVMAVGIVIGLLYFKKAFPEASIDFQVTRAQSEDIAQNFLGDRELGIAGYTNASGFRIHGTAKVFLEKELGLETAQEYFGDPVKLWYWKQRWFKPAQKEEFSVMITPEGDIMGFEHQIPEEQEGDSLTADSAKVLAQDFLEQVMKRDMATLEYVTETQRARPNRMDYTFTYKVQDFEPAPESDYRLEITIQGSEVSGYREYLRVPDTWKQSYDELRSDNRSASKIASLLIVLTIIAMVVIIFFRIQKRDIRWKTAMWFGIVGFGLVLLNELNTLPLKMLNYDTTASFSGFLIISIAEILLGAFLQGGVVIFILTAAAETMYRERYGKFASITRMFSWAGWRTKSFFKAILLGLTLTAFFFAYQIIFYLIADKLGAWAPADVPYSNLLNTAFPWLAVLLIGFYPAVSEEFISRAFSIPFLHKYLKSGLFAIIIPAFIWGFGHAGYPNQPFYIRGLEVGFAGIIIGLVMLRWGILPALVWHYTVDALYTAFLLFRSGNWYFIATAGVATGILVIPLLIALFNYLRTGRFLSPMGIRNQDDVVEPTPEAEVIRKEVPVEAPPEIRYTPLSSGTRVKGIVLGVICLAVILIPHRKLGENAPEFDITSSQATQIADQFLTDRGIDITGMKSTAVVDMWINEHAGKYLLLHGGIAEFNRLTGETYPPNVWEVHRFTPGNRDHWYVHVHPSTGKVIRFQHMLPEEAPGDSISQDSARVIAEAYLTQQGFDLNRYILKDIYSPKQPNRTDHYFKYEAAEGDTLNLEEAKYRTMVGIGGTEIIAGSTVGFYKIPEAWQRQREATTGWKGIFVVIQIAAYAIFFGLAVVYLVILTTKGAVPWKNAALIAIVPTAIIAINGVNLFAERLIDYQVTVPFQNFTIDTIQAYIMSLVSGYLIWLLISALLLGCYPKTRLNFKSTQRRLAGNDTIICVFLALCFTALLAKVHTALQIALPHWIPFAGISVTKTLALPVPFLQQFTEAIGATAVMLLIVGFGIYLWNHALKSWWLRLLAIVLFLFALTPGAAVDFGEMLLSWIHSAILLVLFVFLVVEYLKDNPLHYVAVAFGIIIYRVGLQLLEAPAYTVHGIIVLALGFVVLLWMVSGNRQRAATEG